MRDDVIGLDTNVLVRFLVRDDEKQFTLAQRAISNLTPAEPGYLTVVTLVETFWVLTRAYKLTSADVIETLSNVLDRDDVVTQDETVVRHALQHTGHGADFSDAVIMALCAAAGADSVLTFDRAAARRLGMKLLR